ncbi:MAG: hypothetical protein J5U17_10900 [Candidatus Methanoperedens sp.]|nr:hypothetical protein [Candidatus Methanoperedens sp.]MCE8426269.1 hypothetical protein [Candidatus Methanoperedens sp.]MCE8428015.1 hypothetical protein [Candidatus Methanoperedens sp.]
MKEITKNQDAQFMLLAGFIIAIGLVITTIILNSIIFEVNLAIGGGNELSKYDIINLVQLTKDEFRSAYANRSIDDFNRQLNNFNGNLSKLYALHGEGVNISWETSNWNSNRYANLTENGLQGGKTNWTVIETVRNSTIRVNVTNPGSFQINISNSAAGSWTVTPGYNFTASVTNVTPPYSISFINGASTSGNYSITGNTTYGKNFTRARDYVLNGSIGFFMSRIRTNLTIPITVPW